MYCHNVAKARRVLLERVMVPHKKDSGGVRSGERGGHAIGAALPVHRHGKQVLGYCTSKL
jgi:hypothetical protein